MTTSTQTFRPSIEPIREIGEGKAGSLYLFFSDIVQILGSPNVTDLDDPSKVKASWGFRDAVDGRKGFVWCYKYDRAGDCDCWSVSGNQDFLRELFGSENLKFMK